MFKSLMIFIFVLISCVQLAGQVPECEIDYYDSIKVKEIRINTPDSSGEFIRQGHFLRYSEDGKRSMEGEFKGDQLDGTVITYRDDLSRASEAVYKDGKKISETLFDNLGILEADAPDSMRTLVRTAVAVLPNRNRVEKVGYDRTEKIFVNHGPATVWYYTDGPVFEMGNFKSGKPHGLMTRWGAFGDKQFEGPFKEGEYNGVWVYWFPDGSIDNITFYNNGSVARDILFKEKVKP